jgi:hypothetical protein
MKAKSIKGNSPEEIAKLISECIAKEFNPTLAFVFMPADHEDSEKIIAIMNEKKIQFLGVSAAGKFINTKLVARGGFIDGELEHGSIAVMLLNINPAYFKITFRETGNSATHEISKQIGAEGKTLFTNPAFIIASAGIYADSEKIVAGIEDTAGTEITLFGGCAADESNLANSFVFSNEKISHHALVAIIIDENKISVKGIATCGWKPIGTVRTITKSIDNEIYTIDNEPALDLVLKYLGVKFDLDNYVEVLINIGAYFPLQLQRENAEPVIRTVYSINQERRSLICTGNVPQGSKLRFSLPPDFEVIEQVVEDCIELRETKQNHADAMIMFSCAMRNLSLDATISQEIEKVQQVWGSPLVGYFSAGEIGKSKSGKSEFHNNTCCVVVLKEK